MAETGCTDSFKSLHFAVSIAFHCIQQSFARILSIFDVLVLVSWGPIWSDPSNESFWLLSDILCYSRFLVVNIALSYASSGGIWPDALLLLCQVGSIGLLLDIVSSRCVLYVSMIFTSLEFIVVFWSGERRRQRRMWIHNATFRISTLSRNPFHRSRRRSLLLPLVQRQEANEGKARYKEGDVSPLRGELNIVKVNKSLSSSFVDIIPKVSGHSADRRIVHVHCLYRMRGNAPRTIVFLHQFGGGTFTWQTVMAELSEREKSFNLLAFDRVAHGMTFFSSDPLDTGRDESTPVSEEVITFQDAVNMADFDSSLIDLSLDQLGCSGSESSLFFVASGGAGAKVALDYVENNPRRKVDGIALISPYGLKTDGFPSVLKAVATAQVGRALTMSMAMSEVTGVIPRRSWQSRNVPKPLLEVYRASIETPEWEDAMLNLLQRPIKGTYKDPQCPVLLISGEFDHFVESPDEYENLSQIFSSLHSWVVIPKCGAAAQEESPSQVCDQLLDFIR